MSSKKFYITTTAPYVNSAPHVGFALEIIQADVLARYHSMIGDDVFFNTGTDEHGKKIYEKAIESGKDPQVYVDEYSAKFDDLKNKLNLNYNSFWRTTNPKHINAAQEIWRRVDAAGYIQKGIYKAKYCVGCELEKQDSDLVDGKCPLHPNKEIELIEEENYFFKFSEFSSKLLDHYNKYPDFVIPQHRQKEIRNFVEGDLTDFSISRLKEKMPWGVPVPNDDKHVMFVWFDALVYYISALGWPDNEKRFEDFWGTVEKPFALQVAGKDNLRQQAAMWQAMLMAAGLPPTRQIFIHGFITSAGQKMSKSLGNVIDPFEYVEKYGTDALRYYLLAKISPTEDSDFTKEKFEEVYNADLANGLGNLIARVAAMTQKDGYKAPSAKLLTFSKEVSDAIEKYNLDEALSFIWQCIKKADLFINQRGVWNLKGKIKEAALANLVKIIRQIAYDLKPFLPETSQIIEKQFQGPTIKSEKPLFPRLK
ncbi:MAG: Methionyl-tRNA synthetase [Microgenomates group bacterium GW2011_GWC1_37_8]|uniref:Methionine--tRNA ligase n=1 Tax=Candidatus Woesebacteria bacterium GW2011_GWB1_38_8 TaxID=1618570 RepID=A0A0G0KYI4_9BACT|nr:MAG: Methionyl-tRNA synthetase [Microgenomates group bacterium GW2011_GWC1_37_8]KKQ84718.1 MAG: Methionyl-tRNA synthetase [Candidatus Woesebacteria bacterium GW2011_GWB1_38_8]